MRTDRCLFSGDGAGAEARILHDGRDPSPPAAATVHGVVSNPLPACGPCARAWAKDGYRVVYDRGEGAARQKGGRR